MIWFWLTQRWRILGAMLVLLLALLLVIFVAHASTTVSVRLLGDARAPRADGSSASSVTLPRSGVVQATTPAAPVFVEPDWSAAMLDQRRHELLSALNCARATHGLPALALDPALSVIAGDAWLRLTREPAFTLATLPGDYALRSVIALDFVSPASGTCMAGDFDPAVLPQMPVARFIGIAVFPPQTAWDVASAVILVK